MARSVDKDAKMIEKNLTLNEVVKDLNMKVFRIKKRTNLSHSYIILTP